MNFLIFTSLVGVFIFALGSFSFDFLVEGFENYPPVDSEEFCDWYFEKTPNVPVNHIMENEIHKNPLTLYFLSKFPDASYRVTMTEHSDPPRKLSVYQYYSNNVTAEIEYFFVPCHFSPEPSEFLFQTKAEGVDTAKPNFFEKYEVNTQDDVKIEIKRLQNQHTGIATDYFEILVSSSYDPDTREITNKKIMEEAIHDSILFLTHQKWLNHKEQIVYVYSESVDSLNEREYLKEKLDFFDFGN